MHLGALTTKRFAIAAAATALTFFVLGLLAAQASAGDRRRRLGCAEDDHGLQAERVGLKYERIWDRLAGRGQALGQEHQRLRVRRQPRRHRLRRPLPRRVPVHALDLGGLAQEPGRRPDRLPVPDSGRRRRPARCTATAPSTGPSAADLKRFRSRRGTRPPGRRSSRGRSRPPGRSTVGRPSAPRRRPACAIALGADLERALRVAAGGVDAERDHQRPGARRPRAQSASSPTAASHASSPEPGARQRLRLAPRPAPAPVLVGEAEEVRKPAGGRVDVDRAGEHPRVVVEDLLGAVAVVGVDVDHGDRPVDARRSSAAGGDRRVVEIAGAAEAVASGVMARRPGAGVGDRLAARRPGRRRSAPRRPPPAPPPRCPGRSGSSCRRRTGRRAAVGVAARPPARAPRAAAGGGRGRARPGPGPGRRAGPPPASRSQAPCEVVEQRGVVDREQRLRRDARSASTSRAPRPSSSARIRSARSGTSVPGVRTPTQISAPGSWSRWRSLQTTGIERLIAHRATLYRDAPGHCRRTARRTIVRFSELTAAMRAA